MHKIAATLATLFLGMLGIAAEAQPQCPAYTKPVRAKVRPSTVNPQYVHYNGRSRALVGISASYLCHVEQPGTFGNPPLTPSLDYCEFTNYPNYLSWLNYSSIESGYIPAVGLNTFRLWISLNHSPGIQRRGQAYDHETPFQKPFNTNGAVDDVFFARLKCVLDYAWSLDQIVEITIFDPWLGDYNTSPWKVYFGSNEQCFASKSFVLPNGRTCENDPATGTLNRAGWDKQKQLITELVTRLCSYPNIYYEIANEVDLENSDKIRTWHQEMTTHLTTTEANLNCGHFVGANFHDPINVDGLSTTFKAINAHYAHASSDSRIAAIELLRTRHNYGAGGIPDLNRIFGFNETKITSLFSLPSTGFTFQSSEAARAEAWEFMLSEGGVYDLYGEHWNEMQSDTPQAMFSLTRLNGLLTEANLDRVQRSQSVNNARPAWIGNNSSLHSYGGTNNTRWGAMHSPMTLAGDANFLYIHHSTLEGTGTFQRYKPVIRSSTNPYPAQTIYVVLPTGTYRAEWIDPYSGRIVGSGNFTVTVSNTQTLVPAAKTYEFDIALRIKRL